MEITMYFYYFLLCLLYNKSDYFTFLISNDVQKYPKEIAFQFSYYGCHKDSNIQ